MVSGRRRARSAGCCSRACPQSIGAIRLEANPRCAPNTANRCASSSLPRSVSGFTGDPALIGPTPTAVAVGVAGIGAPDRSAGLVHQRLPPSSAPEVTAAATEQKKRQNDHDDKGSRTHGRFSRLAAELCCLADDLMDFSVFLALSFTSLTAPSARPWSCRCAHP
jgi:hypothetical protein